MPYGVSNSFRRGITKTYARQSYKISSALTTEFPRKRIRMNDNGVIYEESTSPQSKDMIPSSTVPSSPPASDNAPFSSDDVRECSNTPPSSPPPRSASPPPKSRKATLLQLKRKRSTLGNEAAKQEPLVEISENRARKGPPAKKRRQLTQMQIDLGGEVRKACKACGMDYIPSNKEDAALHKAFHAINVGGVDMGEAFLKEATVVNAVGERTVMVSVDGRSPVALRNKALKVLEAVNKELGAIGIEESRLWGRTAVSVTKPGSGRRRSDRGTAKVEEDREDLFKFFLYLIGDKCVGMCLVERIHNASRVIKPLGQTPSDQAKAESVRSSSISVDNSRDAVLLGISRIWTSKSHRRRGIGVGLLECSRSKFFYGIEVPKEMVAFSQPSESGGQLAEAWFGEVGGWHVYDDAR